MTVVQRGLLRSLLVAAVSFGALGVEFRSADAGIIFDNGSYGGTQVGRNYGDVYTMYEDFTLNETTTITGLSWQGHEPDPSGVASIDLGFYSSTDFASSSIFSTTVTATRTANGNPVLSGNHIGFDYEISGLSLTLAAGTYYFSLHQNDSIFVSWDETEGSAQTISGRWQTVTGFVSSEDSVFQLRGVETAVPEPSSLALLGMGGLTLLGYGRRRSSSRQHPARPVS